MKKVLEMKTSSAIAAENLGEIYMAQERPEEAIRWCQQAVAFDPLRLRAWKIMGALYYRKGDLKEAKKVYGSMLELVGQDPAGSLGMGMTLFRERNYAEAAVYLRKALELDSSLEPARRALESISQQRP
jgi:tetratricopeptide (TPR) repeat protein